MTEAWMKRGYERQELLETIQRAILDEEEETHQRMSYQLGISRAFIRYFANKDGLGHPPLPRSKEEEFFQTKILPAIEEFARTPEETLSLAADLYLWESQSIVRHFKNPLQTQECIEPEKVFAGLDSMAEAD